MRLSPNNYATQQLKDFSGDIPEGEWLCSLGLLGSEQDDYEVVLHKEWYRGGSESYVLDFSVAGPDTTQRLIAKACIRLCPGAAMQEMLGRRSQLNDAGVTTPKLYAERRATVLEAHVPYDLTAAWQNATPDTQARLGMLATRTYRTMLEQGFQPLGLHDLRSHGDDVVVVDFGADLGGSQVGRAIPSTGELIAQTAALTGIDIRRD